MTENINKTRNTTVMIFKNGTSMSYQGEMSDDVDVGGKISKTLKASWNSMSNTFKKAFG